MAICLEQRRRREVTRSLAHVVITILMAGGMSILPGRAACGQTADSLARQLTSPDVHVRAEAVARMNALPLEQLTAGARRDLIDLLNREATTAAAAPGDSAADEDETYREYIIDLASAVSRLRDSSALRGLVFLGIQTGQEVQRQVAAFGESSLPVLVEAWMTKPKARPSVVETLGFLAARDGALDRRARLEVLSQLLIAANEYPIALAAAARAASLETLQPVLEQMAVGTPDVVVRSRVLRAASLLEPIRGRTSPEVLLGEVQDWIAAMCRLRSSGGIHRNGICPSLVNEVAAAREHIVATRWTPAQNVLNAALRRTLEARAAGLLSQLEAALIQGNLKYVLSRLCCE